MSIYKIVINKFDILVKNLLYQFLDFDPQTSSKTGAA